MILGRKQESPLWTLFTEQQLMSGFRLALVIDAYFSHACNMDQFEVWCDVHNKTHSRTSFSSALQASSFAYVLYTALTSLHTGCGSPIIMLQWIPHAKSIA